jgi:Tol biopolymer transport system component
MPRIQSKPLLAAALALGALVAAAVAAAGPAAPAPRGSLLISSTRDPALHNELWLLDLRTGRRVDISRSPAADREVAVAPGSEAVAFVSDRGGAEALYVSRPDGRNLRRVAGPYPEPPGRFVHVRGPAWSPDGRRILFIVSSPSQSAGSAEVRIVPADGGPTRRVGTRVADSALWSPDGQRLGIVTVDSKGYRTTVYDVRGRRLWAVNGAPGAWSSRGDLALRFAPLTTIVVAGQDGRIRWRTTGDRALWSPDGRLLAVSDRGALRLLDDRGGIRFRKPMPGPAYLVAWLPEGNAFLVSEEEGRLLRVGLDGRTTVVSRSAGFPSVSADGDLAFVSRTGIVVRRGGTQRTYRVPPSTGLCFGGGLREPLAWINRETLLYVTGHGGQHEGDLWIAGDGKLRRLPGGARSWRGAAEWSPDGSSIVYEAGSALTHGGGCAGPYEPDLRISDADGGNVRVLTRPGDDYDRSPRWSPDGRRVAFERGSVGDEAAFGILIVDAATGRERRVTTGFDSSPTWTADGRAIVYQHDAEIRQIEVADESVTRVARGEHPEAAPTGSLVAFLRGGALWTVRADGTEERRLAAARPPSPSPFLLAPPTPRWSPDGRRLAVPDTRGIVVVGWDGQRQTLVPARGAGNVAWSPDGRTISFTAVVGNHSRGIFNSAYVARTELYTVPASGGRPTRLTNDLANVVGAAAWRP